MSPRERLTLAAGLAVALTAAALTPVFESAAWAPRVLGAVLVVTLAGLAARRLAVPIALQPIITLVALGYYLCGAFAGGTFRLGLVPGSATLHAVQTVVHQGRVDVAQLGPPVPAHAGLVLLCAAGVGAVAVTVDLLAVVLSRAAVAGLPLLLLFAVPSGLVPGGVGWLPFSLGAAGWLGLLLVEGADRVGRWGAPLQAARPSTRSSFDDEASLGRVGRRIGAAALSLAVIVPALLPGLDARLLGGTGSGSGTGTGARTATTYNPITRLHDELNLPQPRQLLVYTTDDPEPDYLRMTTLDQYDGQGWSASKLEGDRQQGKVSAGIPAGVGDEGAAHRNLTMRIGVDSLEVYWLPMPFGPRRVKVDGSWLWDRESETVFSASRTTRGLRAYTVQASRVLPERAALSTAINTDSAVIRRYGGSVDVVPYVAELTDRLLRRAITPYDKALAIQRYFRDEANGFRYDLTSSGPTPSQPDPLSAFLHGKRGFCEQYATAMAVMLRQAGVPSRVAVGFTPGTKIKGRNTYQVTTSDAHAWPEAWFSGLGWTRFEPTPALARTVVPQYSVPAPIPGDGQLPSAQPSTAPAPTSSSAPSGKDPDKLLGNQADAPSGVAATNKGSGRPVGAAISLLVVALVLVLGALPALTRAVRRRRRWRVPGPLVAWRQVEDDAVDVRHRWRAADSPRAAAARLVAARPLPADAVAALERIATAAERARYARPLPAPGDTGRGLQADSATVRSALLAGTGGRTRWRARLLPPSTLAWASSTAGTTVADLLDATDAVAAAARRRLRLRRRAA